MFRSKMISCDLISKILTLWLVTGAHPAAGQYFYRPEPPQFYSNINQRVLARSPYFVESPVTYLHQAYDPRQNYIYPTPIDPAPQNGLARLALPLQPTKPLPSSPEKVFKGAGDGNDKKKELHDILEDVIILAFSSRPCELLSKKSKPIGKRSALFGRNEYIIDPRSATSTNSNTSQSPDLSKTKIEDVQQLIKILYATAIATSNQTQPIRVTPVVENAESDMPVSNSEAMFTDASRLQLVPVQSVPGSVPFPSPFFQPYANSAPMYLPYPFANPTAAYIPYSASPADSHMYNPQIETRPYQQWPSNVVPSPSTPLLYSLQIFAPSGLAANPLEQGVGSPNANLVETKPVSSSDHLQSGNQLGNRPYFQSFNNDPLPAIVSQPDNLNLAVAESKILVQETTIKPISTDRPKNNSMPTTEKKLLAEESKNVSANSGTSAKKLDEVSVSEYTKTKLDPVKQKGKSVVIRSDVESNKLAEELSPVAEKELLEVFKNLKVKLMNFYDCVDSRQHFFYGRSTKGHGHTGIHNRHPMPSIPIRNKHRNPTRPQVLSYTPQVFQPSVWYQ